LNELNSLTVLVVLYQTYGPESSTRLTSRADLSTIT